MAYSEDLAQRARLALGELHPFTERKMFGGLCLMVGGNMCCGVIGERLMLRVGADNHQQTLALKHVSPMDFTGRPMKGMVYVEPSGLKTNPQLRKWIKLAAGFAVELPPK